MSIDSQVTLVQRLVERLNLGIGDDLRERPVPHQPDNLLDDVGALGSPDHQRQLHRRRPAPPPLGVAILRAVDDVRPAYQLGEIRRVVIRIAPSRDVAMYFVHDRKAGSYSFCRWVLPEVLASSGVRNALW